MQYIHVKPLGAPLRNKQTIMLSTFLLSKNKQLDMEHMLQYFLVGNSFLVKPKRFWLFQFVCFEQFY